MFAQFGGQIGHLSYQGLIILCEAPGVFIQQRTDTLVATTYGVGKHMWDVPIIEASVAFKVSVEL